MLVEPSPKLHDQLETSPVDVSLKDTDNGAVPLVDEAVKSAEGGFEVGSLTTIYPDFVSVSDPSVPVAVRETVKLPALE